MPINVSQGGSHLDHFLRQTRIHHVQLSSMADVKASLLLTMASIVISVTIPHLTNPDLKWASFTLIGFSLGSVILAAYSVMPKLRLPGKGKQGTPPDVDSPRFNILFFGDFLRLSYEDFERKMGEIMQSPGTTYEVQIREVYNLGLYLATKKFRFIKLAYVSFILGLVISSGVLLATML
jgi:hypothetical protein